MPEVTTLPAKLVENWVIDKTFETVWATAVVLTIGQLPNCVCLLYQIAIVWQKPSAFLQNSFHVMYETSGVLTMF